MKKTLQLSFLAASLTSSIYGADTITLDTISVSTSQGTELKKKDTTDSMVIITKEQINALRLTNLADALSKLGNISSTQSGGAGQPTSLYLRGMDSKRTLVLIDGIRYNDPTGIGASAQFEQIMLSNVEQIEIIKGAQSGVWGADASAGVINIITSKAKKGFQALANIEYGAFNTKQTSLQTSYATESFDILLGASLYNTDGFSAAEPKQGQSDYGKRFDALGYEKDSYKNRSLNAKFGLNITQNDRLAFSIQTIDSDIAFDGGAGSDSSIPNTQLKNRFYSASYSHKDSINTLNLQFNHSDFQRTTELAGYPSGIATYEYKGNVNEIKLEDKISYLESSFLRLGTSYQKFEQENISPDTDVSYSTRSLFATNYNKFELFNNQATIITESIRYDDYDKFENALTAKIGVKQFLYQDIFIALNAATGFNAPTLDELYGSYGSNPNLKPEKTRTYDITLGNEVFWATAYRNEVRDMIDWVGVWPAPSGYAQVNGMSTFKGFELGYKDFFFDTLGIEGMYTYIDAKNAEDQKLARRPKQQLDARVVYYVSKALDFAINTQYIGERYDAHNRQGAQTGRYTIANAVMNIKANEYITFYGKIDNITDKYYQVVDGYATPGRSLYLGLNAKY
ncbi:MAG: TonB-dependent receptor [Sulfurimonas sp.]|jgi:vitamin B12 transporter|nr:TonB-dependent receptor [Sulfurimonas sp.]